MKRAVFLIPTDLWEQPNTGGPYARAMRQVQYLQRHRAGIRVVSWIRWPDGALARLPSREERDGIGVRRLVLAPPRGSLVRRALFFHRLTRVVGAAAAADGPAEAVVVHDPELLSAGLRAGRALGAPVFYDSHEHFPAMAAQNSPLEARLVDFLERKAAPRLAHVYTVSEGIAERFRAMGAPTTVTYNSKAWTTVGGWTRPRAEARTALGLAEDEFWVGFLGSLSGEEGLDLLLAALRHAPAHVKVYAHGGPQKEAERWQAAAEELGLGGRARILGPVPARELYANFSGLDAGALLLPDKGPNFQLRAPNKLFDYMALGLPVLTTPLREPRRIVDGAGCGLVVEPDPQAVADAMARLAADPGQRARLGEAGQRAFREEYCAERMEARLRGSHPFWR